MSLRRGRVGQPQHLRDVRPVLRHHPVCGSPGHAVQGVADVEQRTAGALQVHVRHVDQPAGDQGLEHRRVAEATYRLLQVRHRRVGELAEQVAAPGHELVQLGQPLPSVAAPLGEQRASQAEREVRVTGQVPGVEQPQRHPEIGRRLLRRLGQRTHGVVDVRARVPQRVPDRARPVAGLHARVVHEHHVEVAVRRELAPSVPADSDQGDPDLRARGPAERIRAQLVGRPGAGAPVARGHGTPPGCGCPIVGPAGYPRVTRLTESGRPPDPQGWDAPRNQCLALTR